MEAIYVHNETINNRYLWDGFMEVVIPHSSCLIFYFYQLQPLKERNADTSSSCFNQNNSTFNNKKSTDIKIFSICEAIKLEVKLYLPMQIKHNCNLHKWVYEMCINAQTNFFGMASILFNNTKTHLHKLDQDMQFA